MIKVNELFAGIGAFRKALERLNIPHEIVGISEIDKYAIKSYETIYGATQNYGDISKVAKLDYADLWTYGFPCQDISQAGHQAGIIKGETRSGLLYEVERLLSVAAEHGELPKYLILENVKNLVGKKFIKQFEEWLAWLDELGYNSYWQVINAKDCGIPQNRERVFAVSIRKDIDTGFAFPQPQALQCSIDDFLEENVEEKYFLSDAFLKAAEKRTTRMVDIGKGFKFEPRDRETDNRPYDNNQSGSKNYRQLHQRVNVLGRVLGKSGKYHQNQEVYSSKGLIGTIKASHFKDPPKVGVHIKCNQIGVLSGGVWDKMYEPFCIRKLTPLECWRLMGFDDEDFRKAEAVNSNSQLYKQAGNSIVVNVLEGILRNLLLPVDSHKQEAQDISKWLDELLGDDE